jgi:hypothetical protein
MRHAVRRAAANSPLGAALQLTLPPAHGNSSLHDGAAATATPLRRVNHSRHPPPLSPQRSASAHRTPDTRRWQCESRSDVAACPVNMVNSAWAGDVRWVCSLSGWTGTPPHPPPPGSQAACTSCRFPEPFERRIGPTPLDTATRRSHHDGGTPWSVPAVLRVGLL